tara:strand:- start:3222 stop:3887 length:666 start_codon:yes stop_codon:yes gene_type:complete
MKKLIIKSFLAIVLIISSCSSPSEVREDPVPSVALLSKPENNTQCLQIEKVKFEWGISENTDSYTITVINLLSSETVTQNSTTNSIEITLPQGKPYSWQITSKNAASAKESKSEVWKFYLSGDAEFNHAPFPAEVIAPKNGATISPGAIELSWKVSDVDTGDTHTFDIFLDKVDAATRIKESLSATKTSVDLGTGVYYWSITATDSKNNKSQSGTHMFTVK